MERQRKGMKNLAGKKVVKPMYYETQMHRPIFFLTRNKKILFINQRGTMRRGILSKKIPYNSMILQPLTG